MTEQISADQIQSAGNDFFNCPLWSQPNMAESPPPPGTTWKDMNGFVYLFGSEIPERLDLIILTWMLLQAKKAGSFTAPKTVATIKASRYKILRGCGLKINSQYYARLVTCLTRWSSVTITFSGTFHDGISYHSLKFGIIDRWHMNSETKYLEITFSPMFLCMISASDLCERIDFPEFRQFRSPLATRLHDMLKSVLEKQEFWETDAVALANNLSMKERYPAHIIPKINVALNRINKMHSPSISDPTSGLPVCQTPSWQPVSLTCLELGRGQILFRFQKRCEHIKTQIIKKTPPETHAKTHMETCMETPPEIHAKTHMETCMETPPEIHAKTHMETFTTESAIPPTNDKGLSHSENHSEAHDRVDVLLVEQQPPPQYPSRASSSRNIREYVESLLSHERLDLERKAIDILPTSLRAIVDKKGLGAKTLIALTMEGLISQKLAKTSVFPGPLFLKKPFTNER